VCILPIVPQLGEFKEGNYFLIGSAFLRNFYSVYNWDRKSVSFAVNKNFDKYATITQKIDELIKFSPSMKKS
jgi:hypothetical protein